MGRQAQPSEDWNILRMLSLYRLLLVALFLVLRETGFIHTLLDTLSPRWFHSTCTIYAVVALGLVVVVYRRWPAVWLQGQLHFVCDLVAITSLVYASGGVPEGLGTLLITPVVGCAMVVAPRLALAQASVATLTLFGEEILRHYSGPIGGSDLTSTGVLGLILFGSSLVASTVAQRARTSEAFALRVGSEFEDLSRLNESIIQTMQTGVLVIDREGRIRSANGAAQRLLSAMGRGFRGEALRAVSPGLADRLQLWRNQGLDGREPLLPRSDAAAEVLPRFSYLGSSNLSPVLILIEDTAVLRQQAQQMKLASLGRLSASIAHEIRNPLSAISHASQLLAESGEIEGQNRRLLGMIGHHSERIEKIVRDVLALSRRAPAARSPIVLRDWLLRAIAQYQEGHPEGSRPMDLGFIPESLIVLFDPNHLQQVLFNLWDNAYEHGGRDGRDITLMMDVGRDESGQDWLDVADDGPGVPAELRDQMFEPFFTTAHGGTGLGLYLVRELSEYNQARIGYQARRAGACFRLTFPGSEA